MGGLQTLHFTDTHCHLDLQDFEADREAVIERAHQAGLNRFLVPALDLESGQRILSLFSHHPDVFAAVGVHPTEVGRLPDPSFGRLQDLCREAKVVAVGEIGLDYYWVKDGASQARQREALEKQLAVAQRASLPVVLHLREAGDAQDGPCSADLMGILRSWAAGLRAANHPLRERPGVLHSYAGTLEVASAAVDLGFYIGVTGPVTYNKAAARRQVIAGLPLERLLLETDSPFLPPAPHRGQRNEPAFVTHIADKIADVQSRTVPEIARVTAANAARLFAWGDPV